MELRRASDGSLLGSASTNEAGDYAFEVIPSGTIEADLTIQARSDSSPWTGVQVKALDGDIQAVSAGPFTLDTNQAIRLDYTVPAQRGGKRLGGLFNIVDCVLTGAEWVSSLIGTSVPSLEVYWQDGSTIWSSYSQGSNRIYLLGGTAGDPDRGDDDSYDDCVILHEYGHFMADRYSLDRSPGGEHQLTGYYSPPLAWSEGWASAFQCFVRNSSLYWDARDGDSEGFNINFETAKRNGERLPRLRTMRNEGAITCVLWDLYDDSASSDPTPGEDDDRVAYPAEWIWTVCSSRTFRPGCSPRWMTSTRDGGNRYPGDSVDEVFAAYRMEMVPSAPEERVVSRMGLNLAIPDTGVPARDSLRVDAAPGRVLAASAVRCLASIWHPNRSDLSIRLRHPDGTSVQLKASRPGGYDSRDVFEWYGYPFYEIPAESLDRFAGKSPGGQWTIEVSDDSSFYTGTLLGWRLRIHQVEPVVF
jgi:subtilisin-like proprotein convertase family protein